MISLNLLLEELKKAEHHINIQFYIFKDDEIGNKNNRYFNK